MKSPASSRRPAGRGLIRAFTLLEILVVLAIIGLLAGLAITNVDKIFGGAQVSTVEIFVKDLGLVLNTGHEHRLPLPLAAAAHQLFLAAAGAGWGKLDDAAVVKVYEQAGDFKVSSPSKR